MKASDQIVKWLLNVLHCRRIFRRFVPQCKTFLCEVVIVVMWPQLWDSSRRSGQRLRAGGEAPVHHVQAAHVRQLAPHVVFLLQRVHHPFPGVRLDFPQTRIKLAGLTGKNERKIKNQMQLPWRSDLSGNKSEYAK